MDTPTKISALTYLTESDSHTTARSHTVTRVRDHILPTLSAIGMTCCAHSGRAPKGLRAARAFPAQKDAHAQPDHVACAHSASRYVRPLQRPSPPPIPSPLPNPHHLPGKKQSAVRAERVGGVDVADGRGAGLRPDGAGGLATRVRFEKRKFFFFTTLLRPGGF